MIPAVGDPAIPVPQEHPGSYLAAAINEGQIEAASNCFARDACLVTPDATAVRGRESIRPILAQMIASETRIEVLDRAAISTAGIEFASHRWRITSRGAEGEAFSQVTSSVLVLSYIEQRWKLVIAAPWGWAAAQVAS